MGAPEAACYRDVAEKWKSGEWTDGSPGRAEGVRLDVRLEGAQRGVVVGMYEHPAQRADEDGGGRSLQTALEDVLDAAGGRLVAGIAHVMAPQERLGVGDIVLGVGPEEGHVLAIERRGPSEQAELRLAGLTPRRPDVEDDGVAL